MKSISYLLPPFLLLVFPVESYGQCPHNAVSKAMECIGRMGDLGLKTDAETVEPWDYERTKIACEHGAFNLAIDCAENIINQCPDQDWSSLLDIPRMRTGVTAMCNQVDDMKPYVSCMQDQLHEVRRCAEEQKLFLNTKLRAAGTDANKRMKSLCSFTTNVYGCQTAPVRHNCGPVPAKFLLDIMYAFRPPTCPPPEGYNSSPQFRISNFITLLPIVLCTYFVISWTCSFLDR